MDAFFTLIDGNTVASADVQFNASAYQFIESSTGQDITQLLPVRSKQQFPGFDQGTYNTIVYYQHYKDTHAGAAPPNIGSSSTWDNFVHQLYTDPLGAPLDQASNILDNTLTGADNLVTKGIGSLITSPGLLVMLAAMGVGLYVFRKPILKAIAV